VSHPSEVVSINQSLPILTVIKVDIEKGKVGLSLKKSAYL
jgi:ribosomal protein S1